MSRVEDSGVGINEIIRLNESIPSHNLLKIRSACQHLKIRVTILHCLGISGRVVGDNNSDNNPSNLQLTVPAHKKARQNEIHQVLNDNSPAQ